MNSVVIFVSTFVFAFCLGAQIEQDLTGRLLDKYDSRIRPTVNPTDVVKMKADIYLLSLNNIDEYGGKAELGIWVGLRWNDPSLAWKPSDYKGVTQLVIPSKQIWVPDMKLLTGEGAFQESAGAHDDFSTSVESNGDVYYARPITKNIPCLVKTDKGMDCIFSVDSWDYSIDMMTVTTTKNTLEITPLVLATMDPYYTIKNATVAINRRDYIDQKGLFWDSVKTVISLERKQQTNQ